ncbi:tyrosine-type recombinase/integrase [Cytophagaceae bacterium SJW1-29]|nr:tyrosine-type recombinase/integrase [Cytophagaceae bacterium SJW1-29]
MPSMISIGGFFFLLTAVLTNSPNLYGMSRGGNYPFVLASLKDRGGDVSKYWYIEWYAWDVDKGELRRGRKQCPAKYKTDKARRAWAGPVVDRLNKLLNEGAHFAAGTDQKEADFFKERVPADVLAALDEILKLNAANFRKKTKGTYQSAVNKLRGFFAYYDIKPMPLARVPDNLGARFTEYMQTVLGNNARTVNNTNNQIKILFNLMDGRGWIDKGKVKTKKLGETDSGKNIAFLPEHQEIIEAWLLANDFDLWVFTRFLYFAFIRPRELAALRFENINLTQRAVMVPGLVSKNKKLQPAAIVEPFRVVLTDHVWPRSGKGRGRVFGKGLTLGGPGVLAENAAYERHRVALAACGLAGLDYTLYSWKHTGVVNAYLAGVDIVSLQQLLRHQHLSTTEVYLKSLGLRVNTLLLNSSW